MACITKIYGRHQCGVPQCKSYGDEEGISMHRIPKHVLSSKKESVKWKVALKMGKNFPKHFVMCNRHFKPTDIICHLNRPIGALKKTRLARNAFSSLNLPVTSFENKPKFRMTVNSNKQEPINKPSTITNGVINIEDDFDLQPEREKDVYEELDISEDKICECFCHDKLKTSIPATIGSVTSERSIATQVTIEPLQHGYFLSLLDGDNMKLCSMTGIPNFDILEKIVEAIHLFQPVENCLMSLKNRILLTMFRVKTNFNNFQISIFFQINEKTAKKYFAETIQVLAEVLKDFIIWQTKDQNARNLPKCFWGFPNTMTILDCTEIQTVTFSCLTCRTSLYSHYKGCHTVKVLIGVAPSGLINFVSKAVSGRASDKAVFNSTNLLSKLEKGDAVMVDKGFMIGDELLNAGIEMIRPAFMVQKMTKEEVIRNTKIASARVHVERRFARIKKFKILSDKVDMSVLPYIDDIVTIICGLSNLSSPIMNDNKFC